MMLPFSSLISGMPFHGLVQNGELTLPNAEVMAVATPSPDTFLVGNAETLPAMNDDVLALNAEKGYQWRTRCTASRKSSPSHTIDNGTVEIGNNQTVMIGGKLITWSVSRGFPNKREYTVTATDSSNVVILSYSGEIPQYTIESDAEYSQIEVLKVSTAFVSFSQPRYVRSVANSSSYWSSLSSNNNYFGNILSQNADGTDVIINIGAFIDFVGLAATHPRTGVVLRASIDADTLASSVSEYKSLQDCCQSIYSTSATSLFYEHHRHLLACVHDNNDAISDYEIELNGTGIFDTDLTYSLIVNGISKLELTNHYDSASGSDTIIYNGQTIIDHHYVNGNHNAYLTPAPCLFGSNCYGFKMVVTEELPYSQEQLKHIGAVSWESVDFTYDDYLYAATDAYSGSVSMSPNPLAYI